MRASYEVKTGNIMDKKIPQNAVGGTPAPAAPLEDAPRGGAARRPHELCVETFDPPEIHTLSVDRKRYSIRYADSHGHRANASMLIEKMYAWRGYEGRFQVGDEPNRVTLVASNADATVGTVTVGIDSPIGLLTEDIYRDEIVQLRGNGRRLCEFTKLAVDRNVGSLQLLAALFHIAYIYASRLHHCTDLLVEVVPHHAAFYRKLLGLNQVGAEKINRRINAAVVLLHLDFAYAEEQMRLMDGNSDGAVSARSLYPYCFSPDEVDGIAARLATIH